jgi:hypothetical protein
LLISCILIWNFMAMSLVRLIIAGERDALGHA